MDAATVTEAEGGMPSMGKHTASAMDEALDEADLEDASEDDAAEG